MQSTWGVTHSGITYNIMLHIIYLSGFDEKGVNLNYLMPYLHYERV